MRIAYFVAQVPFLLSNHINIDPILFFHFTWLGIVLGISGIIGLWALMGKVRFGNNKIEKLPSPQNIKEHIPIHG